MLECKHSQIWQIFKFKGRQLGQFWSDYFLTPFPKQALLFTCLHLVSFENTVGKGEIARNEQFLLSPSVFYTFIGLSAVFIEFKIVVCNLFQFGRVQNLSFGKGIIEIIRDLMVIHILTKSGDDWFIFVDASVNKEIVDGPTLNRWTDGK